MSCFDGGANGRKAWIADDWTARVTADADRFAVVEVTDDSRSVAAFVVVMVGQDDGRTRYVQQRQQVACMACVFAEEDVKTLDGLDGARRHVAQIADGSCDEIEFHSLQWRQWRH